MSLSSRLAKVGAVVIAAAALSIASVAPAFAAFGPADITVTPRTTGENPDTDIAIVCPTGSTNGLVTWTGLDGGALSVLGPTTWPLVAGEATNFYALESFFDRDTDATFALDCRDAGNASTGTDSVVYHLPTTGAVSSTPATLAANAPLVASGTCGTATSIVSVSTYLYTQPGSVLVAGFPVTTTYNGTGNYSVDLGTPSSHAISAGTSVLVQVFCNTSAPTAHSTSSRLTTTVVSAAVIAAAGPTAAALPTAGSESWVPASIAAALLAAGALLLLARRRRTTAQ